MPVILDLSNLLFPTLSSTLLPLVRVWVWVIGPSLVTSRGWQRKPGGQLSWRPVTQKTGSAITHNEGIVRNRIRQGKDSGILGLFSLVTAAPAGETNSQAP